MDILGILAFALLLVAPVAAIAALNSFDFEDFRRRR
jgi:hypothetical protein